MIPLIDDSANDDNNKIIEEWNKELREMREMGFNGSEFEKLFYANQDRTIYKRVKYAQIPLKFASFFLSVIYDRFYEKGYYIPFSKKYFTSEYVLKFDHGMYSGQASIDFNFRLISGAHEKIKKSQDQKMNEWRNYQKMRSAIVTKGFDNLNDDEQAFWNSAF